MSQGVVLLNFGEPSSPDRDVVIDYLTRIFYNNASLEDADTEEEAMERSRELAQRRVGGLLEEYELINGSPLNEQAETRREALDEELADRGYDVPVYHGYQFMEPLIPDVAQTLADDGIESVTVLPSYPLCGPSTNVQAIRDLREEIDAIEGYDPSIAAVSGWHQHPTYTRIRADTIRSFVADEGLNLQHSDTGLVFSAHGTPRHYLEAGSRYDTYVEEYCTAMAGVLGVEDYYLGYQNHENRDIPWTEPDIESVIESCGDEVGTVVVDPISFLHEQSETLIELDHDLAEDAGKEGLDFHRVPVPHDDSRLPAFFADLIEPHLAGFDPSYYQQRKCQCVGDGDTYCLNAPLQ